MTELKRCPFCGGEAVVVEEYLSEEADASADEISYFVSCDLCASRTDNYATKEQAIKKWNNRPSPWHTGTPTEEGDYLLILKAPKGQPHYFTNNIKKDGRWRYVFRGEVIAWQKIEPYKEKEDGKE